MFCFRSVYLFIWFFLFTTSFLAEWLDISFLHKQYCIRIITRFLSFMYYSTSFTSNIYGNLCFKTISWYHLVDFCFCFLLQISLSIGKLYSYFLLLETIVVGFSEITLGMIIHIKDLENRFYWVDWLNYVFFFFSRGCAVTTLYNEFLVVHRIIDLFLEFFTLSSTIALSCKSRYILMLFVIIYNPITIILVLIGKRIKCCNSPL